MKRVLLVSANQEEAPYPVAPIGLLYIAQALRKAGFGVSMLDLCFSRNSRDDIKKAIGRRMPDFIGVSLRNVDNLTFPASISYLPRIKGIIKTVKHYTAAPVVLGGSAFSLFPKEILKFMNCEWGIVGEGEDALVGLFDVLNRGSKNYKTIDNLVWKKDGEIYSNRVRRLDSSFCSVLDYGLIDNRLYARFAGMANVQTKRGCGFKCAYCTYPSIEGRNYRLRPPQVVAEEMRMLKKKYAMPHVFFVDDIFTHPAGHASSVCEALLKSSVKIKWSCFASPLGVSKKLLTLMRKAGCTHIEFGSDALSDRVLTRLKKPFLCDDIFRASRLCREAGIKCAHYVMFGAPGENHSSLKEGLAAIGKLRGDVIIAMVGIRIYPKTELEKMSIREGVIKSDTNLLFPRFYLSSEVPVDELLANVKDFSRNNPQCVVPGLGIRSSEDMYALLRKHYREGPLWGYL
jgi:radical SAM superfamily enzyme YgiQ (UPF0313 family)